MDNLQSLPVEDFSGGMTDFIIGGSPRQNEKIQNQVIDENRDLITRDGSRPKYEYRITATEIPRQIVQYRDDFLVQAESSLYALEPSSAVSVGCTGGTDAFTGAGASTRVIQSFWNDNVIFTSDDLIAPLRYYKEEDGTHHLERLGMPHILLGYLLTLSNDLKTNFNSHIVDLTEHSSSDIANEVTLADATDLLSLLDLTNELLAKYELHLDEDSKHPGTVPDTHRLEERSVETIYGAATALSDMKAKFNAHDENGTAHTAGGADHQVTAKATRGELITSAGGTGSSYLYALHYKYTYKAQDKTFLENSDVLYLDISDVGDAETNSITITLPELTALAEYNVAEIKVAIFRTFDNGQSFFKLDEVPASQATYLDTKSDEDIENSAPLYTEGGVLPDEPPPLAKYSAMVNDSLVLGFIRDGATTLPNVAQISKPGKPFSHPSSFRIEFEDTITGIGYINTYPIFFLEQKLYRLEGSFDSFGKGFLRKRLISDAIGTLSHGSIVNTKEGVFFAGPDGYYFTDGFRARKISTDINHTFNNLYNKNQIEGTYDRLNNRVLWSAKRDSANGFNDAIYVAHADYPSDKDGFAFTYFNGGIDIDNFLVSGLGFDNSDSNNNLLRLHPEGYLLYHDEDLADDAFVSNEKTPDLWDTQTIIYSIDSVALDCGNPKLRKWIPKLNLNAANVSSLSLQVQSSNDNTNQFEDLKVISAQANLVWGEPSVLWGSDDILWNLLPIISRWRYFPAIRQPVRCMYKQLRFTNAYTEVDSSQTLGEASVDSASATVTLLQHPAQEWPLNSVNYFISFGHEGNVFEYKVISATAETLTISNPGLTLTDSTNTSWTLKGYKKGEILSLSNYVLSYAPITMTQATAQGDS